MTEKYRQLVNSSSGIDFAGRTQQNSLLSDRTNVNDYFFVKSKVASAADPTNVLQAYAVAQGRMVQFWICNINI